jgi:hypothetical protein
MGAAATWAEYQAIFAMPNCEIRPRVMSYGFSNPTIRIIDLVAARNPDATSSPSVSSLGPECVSGSRANSHPEDSSFGGTR